jgi:inorganic pyrophosphatase/exopolyphosphatase
MELLSVENIDFDSNFIEVLFDGIFKEGFYVTTDFTFNEYHQELKDEETNCKDHFEPVDILFYDFKIFNAEHDLITINDRETKKIKELVEFKLIDLLTEEINN